jgi:hypothetical protein
VLCRSRRRRGDLVGKRPTSPTMPMILAASTGPMPKIPVRVVPEASISASMRPPRSAIFPSRVRTSRSTSEASRRRRRRAEAPPWSRMPRRMLAARSAESFPATPPGRRSRKSACRRFSALVRSATRSISASRRAGAAPQRRPRARPWPAFRCARRPAQRRGHRGRRSCERCRSKVSAPAPRAWAARPPPTRLSPPTSPPGVGRGRRRSPSPNDARGTASPSVRGTSSLL